jgi:hypothetical protein
MARHIKHDSAHYQSTSAPMLLSFPSCAFTTRSTRFSLASKSSAANPPPAQIGDAARSKGADSGRKINPPASVMLLSSPTSMVIALDPVASPSTSKYQSIRSCVSMKRRACKKGGGGERAQGEGVSGTMEAVGGT